LDKKIGRRGNIYWWSCKIWYWT